MKNISKALKFIGLEVLISIPLLLVFAYLAFGKIEAGSFIEAVSAVCIYLVVTVISIAIFNKKFVFEDRLRFPLQVGITLLIVEIFLGFMNIIYGIISFIVLWIFLKIKFRDISKSNT